MLVKVQPEVRHVHQVGFNTCWAYCLYMVMNQIRKRPYLDVAEIISHRPKAEGLEFIKSLMTILRDYGYSSKQIYKVLDTNEIKREIQSNRPFIIFLDGLAYVSHRFEDVGHAMVVGGYEETSKGIKLYIYDPASRNSVDIYSIDENGYLVDETSKFTENNFVWTCTMYYIEVLERANMRKQLDKIMDF